MANPTTSRKPPKTLGEKPDPDFPLTPHHASKQWCKKIKGQHIYFGPLSDPDAALAKYLKERDDWQAGRNPRVPQPEAATLKELANRFLTVKLGRVHTGELSLRTFHDYKRCCATVLRIFGKSRLISDLKAEDFERLRTKLADGRSKVSLSNYIRLVRILFKYAYDVDLIEKPIKFLKASLAPPGKKELRKERHAKPKRMFQAAEIRSILGIAGIQLRAMTLLAINGGFGQSDLSALPTTAVDLDAGWVDFPRVKTAVERRVPLWPETVAALRAAIEKRPAPREAAAKHCLFVTKYGRQFVRATEKGHIDSIGLEFGKLLATLKIKREGLNFYGLRHTFETVGGEAKDQISVDFLMGHAPASDDMSAVYREQISDQRLKAVTEHVRKWLWPPGSEAAWLKVEKRRK